MRFLTWIGRLFPRNAASETVATMMDFAASPEQVWESMMFYEEVPGRPSWLLRLFLPAPVRTGGAKTRVGATIECVYDGGHLEKRITESETAQHIAFDVTMQALGIEDVISMTGGSYDIRSTPGGSTVVLTTVYRGHLRPRWLFRPLEHYLAHRLHRHILDGMRAVLATADPASSKRAEQASALPSAAALSTMSVATPGPATNAP